MVVTALGAFAFAHRAAPPDLKIVAHVRGTPTAERPEAAATAPASATFLGSGSWTMSSLPACFRERERERGPTALLQAKFPPVRERLRPASVVRSGDCTIVVGEHALSIARGNDRLRVPPEAALYRGRSGLTLVWVNGGRAEIRRY